MGKSIIGHLVYSHAKGTFPRKGLPIKMSPYEVNCIGETFISYRHTFLGLLLLYFNNCFTAPITDSFRRALHLSASARGNHMSLQIALSLPSSSLERSKFQPHFCFPMNIREMVCYLAFISTGPMFVFYYNTTLFFACLEIFFHILQSFCHLRYF